MEIKLTKRKSAAKEIELKPAKRKTAAILNDSGRETENAIQLQPQEKRVKRIVVLRCGTVYLQNFSKDMNEPGRQLKLIREPDNPYDRWAQGYAHCPAQCSAICRLACKNQSVARLMDAERISLLLWMSKRVYRHGNSVRKTMRLPLRIYMDVRIAGDR